MPGLREQLDLSTENPVRGLDAEPAYLRLDGPNQWPAEEMLPGFRSHMAEYFHRICALADTLLEVFAVGLGLGPDHLRGVFGEMPLSFVKLISYPPTPPDGAGVNPHHDAGFLALLLQHDVGGLQVRNPVGEWIDVPPRLDAFVVNIGEMLQEMTGNYFVATTHRVIAGRARQSSAGFMARRTEIESGIDGIDSQTGAGVYGQQLWNYYCRSYPDNVARHHS